MDPNSIKSPGLALPNPSAEGGVHTSMPLPPNGEGGEVRMPSVEVMPTNGAAAPPTMPPPASLPVTMPAPSGVTPDPSVTASATATDDTTSDNLDIEWINKAKAIVEQTKNDPYMESHELGKVKADYLRIRYNKTIKVVEDQPR